MVIKNKLEKFFLSLSSFLLMVTMAMGMKIESDGEKLDKLKEEFVNGRFGNDAASAREENFLEAEKFGGASSFPVADGQILTETKVVVPAKATKQAPVASTSPDSKKSSKKSSKKTRSS